MQSTQWSYLDTLAGPDIAAILQEWRKHQPGTGVFALVCEQEREAVALLQEIAAAEAMPLVGAIVPGLIAEAKFWRKGVLLVAFDATISRQIVPLPHAENYTADATVEVLADFIATHADENGGDTLLLLVDATMPDVASLLDRLYLEIGDQVNYAGTCVGSEASTGAGTASDKPMLIASALNSKVDFFIDAGPHDPVCKDNTSRKD